MLDLLRIWPDHSLALRHRLAPERRRCLPLAHRDPGLHGNLLRSDSRLSPIEVLTIPVAAVDCMVGEWSEWHGWCSGPCGGWGDQPRQRQVTQYPSNGGAACPSLTDTRPCFNNCGTLNLIQFLLTLSSGSDCQVSDWSEWGACSNSCGGGVQARGRQVTQQATNGGAACPELSQTQACTGTTCGTLRPAAPAFLSSLFVPAAVDCIVSDWTAWNACSASCGAGQQTRSRSVSQYSANGGVPCPSLAETQACIGTNCRPFFSMQPFHLTHFQPSTAP